MIDFWQLPEPARFIRTVVEDLRAGYNVVLAIPDHVPGGWATTFRAALFAASLPRLEGIQPDGSTPISAIYKALRLGPCSPRATVSGLCDQAGFRGRILHVQQFTPDAWQAWSNFLQDYEDACRHLELAERTLFIVTLAGELAISAPAPANLLRVHRWLDRMDGLNARLHAANLLAANTQTHWQRQLTVALLAELALWDPEVVTAGASLPLADILEPGSWLVQIAVARGWSVTDDLMSPAAEWRGLRQLFEGRRCTHSAWLALADRKEALAHRVWSGQVAALFPILERHRRGLLYCYRRLLRVPWSTQFATINELEDLELNHIADQLRPQSRGDLRDVYEFVSWLRDVRNDLAHLTSVTPERLLEPRFQSRMGNFLTSEDD
jgi:hypothetical protein